LISFSILFINPLYIGEQNRIPEQNVQAKNSQTRTAKKQKPRWTYPFAPSRNSLRLQLERSNFHRLGVLTIAIALQVCYIPRRSVAPNAFWIAEPGVGAYHACPSPRRLDRRHHV